MSNTDKENRVNDLKSLVDKNEEQEKKETSKLEWILKLGFVFLIMFMGLFTVFYTSDKKEYVLLTVIFSSVIALFFVFPLIVKYFFWLAFRERIKYTESLFLWFTYIFSSAFIIVIPLRVILRIIFGSLNFYHEYFLQIMLAFLAFPFIAMLAIFIFQTIKKILVKEN